MIHRAYEFASGAVTALLPYASFFAGSEAPEKQKKIVKDVSENQRLFLSYGVLLPLIEGALCYSAKNSVKEYVDQFIPASASVWTRRSVKVGLAVGSSLLYFFCDKAWADPRVKQDNAREACRLAYQSAGNEVKKQILKKIEENFPVEGYPPKEKFPVIGPIVRFIVSWQAPETPLLSSLGSVVATRMLTFSADLNQKIHSPFFNRAAWLASGCKNL